MVVLAYAKKPETSASVHGMSIEWKPNTIMDITYGDEETRKQVVCGV